MDVIRFLNLEYFYQKAIDLFSVSTDFSLRALLERLGPFITILLLILLTFTIYSIIRLRQVRQEEKEKYATAETEVTQEMRNEKWDKILELLNSENSSDWRQSILEADIMLDSLLEAQGYHGETMGEKMKGIEKSDFITIDYAWEAHKARNRIAHDGSDFILTQREARRLINLFSRVFQEFEFI